MAITPKLGELPTDRTVTADEPHTRLCASAVWSAQRSAHPDRIDPSSTPCSTPPPQRPWQWAVLVDAGALASSSKCGVDLVASRSFNLMAEPDGHCSEACRAETVPAPASHQPSGEPGLTGVSDLVRGSGSGTDATGCAAADGCGVGAGSTRRRGNVFGLSGFWTDGGGVAWNTGEAGAGGDVGPTGVLAESGVVAGAGWVTAFGVAPMPAPAAKPAGGTVGAIPKLTCPLTMSWSSCWRMTRVLNTPTTATAITKQTNKNLFARAHQKSI
jgi:hypothetical protein